MKTLLIVVLFVCVLSLVWADDPELSGWEWAIHAGSNWLDYGYSVAVDAEGNSYVTGSFERTANFGALPPISTPSGIDGDADIFVAKVDPDGIWLWAVRAGSIYSDRGRSVAVDNMGNVYVTGSFYGTADFGALPPLVAGGVGSEIFIAKLDAANGNWLWAQKAGGYYDDLGRSIAVDNAGNVYFTGFFWLTASFGGFSLTSDQDEDIFVAKINSAGVWQWAVKAGGSYSEEGLSLVIDDGYGYVTGFFVSDASFGAYDLLSTGVEDIFVAKIDCSNGDWVWASQAGGNFQDKGYSIALDADGCPYVTGSFQDFADFGTHTLSSFGSNDIFVAKMNLVGEWLWATSAGGSGDNKGHGITVDKLGNSYIIGSYSNSVVFGGLAPLICMGEYDAFVAGINLYGEWFFTIDIKGLNNVQGMSIAIDYEDYDTNDYNLIVAGYFKNTIYFSDSDFTLTSPGCSEIFVAKLCIEPDISQPVELASFTAQMTTEMFVDLAWVSESETSMLGYRIYRAEVNSLNNAYQITSYPILANNTSGPHIYHYIDEYILPGMTYYYWLQAVDLDLTHSFHGPVSIQIVNDEPENPPEIDYITRLMGPFPNPFNPGTDISYVLENPATVTIEIFNARGQLVNTLVKDSGKGNGSIYWNGRDVNGSICKSGVYLYKFTASSFYTEYGKMMLLK